MILNDALGVLAAEGDDHRRQRRIMNPCFTSACIRDLVPNFWAKSFEVRSSLVEGRDDIPNEVLFPATRFVAAGRDGCGREGRG